MTDKELLRFLSGSWWNEQIAKVERILPPTPLRQRLLITIRDCQKLVPVTWDPEILSERRSDCAAKHVCNPNLGPTLYIDELKMEEEDVKSLEEVCLDTALKELLSREIELHEGDIVVFGKQQPGREDPVYLVDDMEIIATRHSKHVPHHLPPKFTHPKYPFNYWDHVWDDTHIRLCFQGLKYKLELNGSGSTFWCKAYVLDEYNNFDDCYEHRDKGKLFCKHHAAANPSGRAIDSCSIVFTMEEGTLCLNLEGELSSKSATAIAEMLISKEARPVPLYIYPKDGKANCRTARFDIDYYQVWEEDPWLSLLWHFLYPSQEIYLRWRHGAGRKTLRIFTPNVVPLSIVCNEDWYRSLENEQLVAHLSIELYLHDKKLGSDVIQIIFAYYSEAHTQLSRKSTNAAKFPSPEYVPIHVTKTRPTNATNVTIDMGTDICTISKVASDTYLVNGRQVVIDSKFDNYFEKAPTLEKRLEVSSTEENKDMECEFFDGHLEESPILDEMLERKAIKRYRGCEDTSFEFFNKEQFPKLHSNPGVGCLVMLIINRMRCNGHVHDHYTIDGNMFRPGTGQPCCSLPYPANGKVRHDGDEVLDLACMFYCPSRYKEDKVVTKEMLPLPE